MSINYEKSEKVEPNNNSDNVISINKLQMLYSMNCYNNLIPQYYNAQVNFLNPIYPLNPLDPANTKFPIRTYNDEDFVYVNSKQYLRILHRREQRKKQNIYNLNKMKQKLPYKHESRHIHACKRKRGKGGKFV